MGINQEETNVRKKNLEQVNYQSYDKYKELFLSSNV